MPVLLDKRMLSAKEASNYIGIGVTLLYHWISKGKIPVVKINSRTLIDVNDLDRFIDNLKDEQKSKLS
jgi:excisionase family DNA binding protein